MSRAGRSKSPRKKNCPRPLCPRCGSTSVVPFLYGLATVEHAQAEERGELKIGGCCISECSPRWHCRECTHNFGRVDWNEGPMVIGLPTEDGSRICFPITPALRLTVPPSSIAPATVSLPLSDAERADLAIIDGGRGRSSSMDSPQVTRPLSDADRADLGRLETIIDRNRDAFRLPALALLEIQDRRLYRVAHSSFHAYCRSRWALLVAEERWRLIQAAKLIRERARAGLPSEEERPGNKGGDSGTP